MRLLAEHPQIAFRDCAHCLKYQYDEQTGKPYESRDGHPAKRHWGCPPPCRTPIGCPKGTPEQPKSLSRQNMQAYEHYKTCKAVGRFPEDSIVERNATLFAMAEESQEFTHRAEVSALLKGMIARG